jgi:PAS domain-containing protein
VFVVLSLVALRVAIWPLLGEAAPLLLLVAGPAIAAYLGGFGPGIAATALSAVLGNLLFIEPRAFFRRPRTRGVDAAAVFVVLGVLVTWTIDARSRALARLAIEHRRLLDAQAQLVARERRISDDARGRPLGPCCIADASGRIRLANAQAEAMFGFTRDDCWTSSSRDLVPIERRDRHRRERNDYQSAPTCERWAAGGTCSRAAATAPPSRSRSG